MRAAGFAAILLIAGCTEGAVGTAPGTPGSASDPLANATPVTVWATYYYMPEVEAQPAGRGVPLRDMSNAEIGPTLSASDWCDAAVEGVVSVGGKVYTYAGTRSPKQATCRNRASQTVRWQESPHPFGTGAQDNPLEPFRTVACDLGTVSGSKPWVSGGYPKLGQKILIPAAKGTALPDGTVHDGVFTCADVGGAITGNHIDVFIGPVKGGERAADAANPFAFIASDPSGTVEAYLLAD